jgi:hypothetical protein
MVRNGCAPFDSIRVVKQSTQVANPANAGVETSGCLTRLLSGIAENALLGFPGLPVKVDLFVRATGNAHPPCPAFLLAHKDNTILATLVDGASWTGGNAARVEAMVADTWEMEKDQSFEKKELLPFLVSKCGKIEVAGGVNPRTSKVVVPVRSCLDRHFFTGDHGDWPRDWLVIPSRSVC